MAKRCIYCGDYLSQLDYQLYECWNEECLMVREKGFPIEWFETTVSTEQSAEKK